MIVVLIMALMIGAFALGRLDAKRRPPHEP